MKAKRASTMVSWPQLEQLMFQNSMYLDALRQQNATTALVQKLYVAQQQQNQPSSSSTTTEQQSPKIPLETDSLRILDQQKVITSLP